jgi:hypothetical protein
VYESVISCVEPPWLYCQHSHYFVCCVRVELCIKMYPQNVELPNLIKMYLTILSHFAGLSRTSRGVETRHQCSVYVLL